MLELIEITDCTLDYIQSTATNALCSAQLSPVVFSLAHTTMPRLRNVSCINYPSVDVALIHTTAIFPPVGIARLGDSEDEYFIGPELPMIIDARAPHPPTPDGKFRDAEGRIRRQVLFLMTQVIV